MSIDNQRPTKRGMRSGFLLFSCVCALALPSAVLAFGTPFRAGSGHSAPINSIDTDPDSLAGSLNSQLIASGQRFPFTPAGTPDRPARSVMVAVRVDPKAPQAIIVHATLPTTRAEAEPARLHLPQTAFNLGMARGYQNFAQSLVQAQTASPSELPNLENYSLKPGVKQGESRFSPRISIDEKRAPGRAPRTFAQDAGEVDLGGAYRVTDNLDVTAGVRYSQDRERLVPAGEGKQDSQAVYVGTQFRF